MRSTFTTCKILVLAAAVFLLLNSRNVRAQMFHHSTPETMGMTSAGVDSFVYALEKVHEMHSFMLLRHGDIIAEGWWNPYRQDLKHSLYSLSKSFTSTAVGFAVSEKKLAVTDKVIKFFPNYLPAVVSPYLASLTVKDLLTMSVGQEPDPTTVIPFKGKDWVKSFLATPIKNKPGTRFLYNTMATYMLSAIVQKVTGQREFDYLKPRLFDPLRITDVDWEVSDEGINTGGWGLRLRTEDLAKMGQLYLQKGLWDGKQVIPEKWIDEATSFKIDQAPGESKAKKDSSDWKQGYCYQFWRCRHNAFRGDGAFGQFILVMPDEDAVLVMTAETADMQAELNLVWKYLLPVMHDHQLEQNDGFINLQEHLKSLYLPPLASKSISPEVHKTFTLDENGLGLKSISMEGTGNNCRLTLKTDTATYNIDLETGRWLWGTTTMQSPSLLAKAFINFSPLKPFHIASSFRWVDNKTLQMEIRFMESPHAETITCHFDGDKLNANVDYSFNWGKNSIALTGTLVK